MGLVTDPLANGSLGFVNMCHVLTQQSGRADNNADLDAVLLPDNSNYTYDYFRLSHLFCIKTNSLNQLYLTSYPDVT